MNSLLTFYVTDAIFKQSRINELRGYYFERFPKMGDEVRILNAERPDQVRMTKVCAIDEKGKLFDVEGGVDGSSQ
jgi:hypothetical protein